MKPEPIDLLAVLNYLDPTFRAAEVAFKALLAEPKQVEGTDTTVDAEASLCPRCQCSELENPKDECCSACQDELSADPRNTEF